jgi:broad specificity phosphatase PhoE
MEERRLAHRNRRRYAKPSPERTCPPMIFLRHGQSEFNLLFTQTRRDPGIIDPKLTPLGQEQAQRAAEELARRDIRRIVVSPYTRALQTATPVARALGLPLTVTPTVRERYAFTCDIGSPVTQLRAEWPDVALDHLEEIWWPPQEEPAEQVLARAARFRGEMSALEDWSHTVVVSHWGFILSMTGQSVTNGQWLDCDPTEPPLQEVSWKHH